LTVTLVNRILAQVAELGLYCTAGVFNAMAVIGPALGYVFGAMSLKVFTDFYIFTSDQ